MASFSQVFRSAGWRWVYPALLASMVVVASGRSQVAAPHISHIDKMAHFCVFGLLATLVVRSPGIKRWWWAVVMISAFGISDEFRQSFTPGRSVEFADWLADTGGGALAVTLYTFWARYRLLLETPLYPRRKDRRATPVAAADLVANYTS